MKNRTKLPQTYLGIIILLMYIPIILVIIYSFNESKLSSVWEGFSLVWYEELFADDSYFEALINSLVLASASCISAGVIGTLGAYGMSKIPSKTKGFIEYVSMIPIMIPEIILGMVFLVFFALIGIPFGMGAMIIAHTTFCIPYVFMQVKARLVGMDKSLEEAALDLGATKIKTFVDIVLPLIAPAIVSGMLLSFAMSFDDVIISMFVAGPESNTLPLKIYTQLRTGVTPKVNAMCTLLLGVTILMCTLSALIARIGQPKKIKVIKEKTKA